MIERHTYWVNIQKDRWTNGRAEVYLILIDKLITPRSTLNTDVHLWVCLQGWFYTPLEHRALLMTGPWCAQLNRQMDSQPPLDRCWVDGSVCG